MQAQGSRVARRQQSGEQQNLHLRNAVCFRHCISRLQMQAICYSLAGIHNAAQRKGSHHALLVRASCRIECSARIVVQHLCAQCIPARKQSEQPNRPPRHVSKGQEQPVATAKACESAGRCFDPSHRNTPASNFRPSEPTQPAQGIPNPPIGTQSTSTAEQNGTLPC